MDLALVLSAVGGGVLIGASATALLALDGKIAGISNIAGGLVTPRKGDTSWRLAFTLGLLGGGGLLGLVHPAAFPAALPRSPVELGVGGLLVGWGAAVGNGCTSGHGVCGLGRRSLRSLVATLSFIGTGVATVYVVEHVLREAAR